MAKNEAINNIFPCPVYITHRESDLDSIEVKDVEDIIKDGTREAGNFSEGRYSTNTYIFNTKLKEIKKFCEEHIKIYVREIINPKEKLDFYITQSWLTHIKPREGFQRHFHSNSIISGAFYISVGENDKIRFLDSMAYQKNKYQFEPLEYNLWNSGNWSFDANNNMLMLFPSWLEHDVKLNENTTTDRISIAFNVFARGIFGASYTTDVLIL